MELFSLPWWSALLAIILIDLVLAGDNAIVIALAARKLPPDLQKKAIIWGTVGAIGVRSLMTFAVVWLLQIPGLMLVGGLGLLWIAFNLINSDADEDHGDVAASTFWGAMKTIVVADALMGIDNVLGVAGAASGSFELVALGLMISIPIVMFGSQLVLKLVARWPIIIPLGGAVLAFTSAQMVVNESLFKDFFSTKLWYQEAVWWGVHIVFVAAILAISWLHKKRQQAQTNATDLETV
ncbi:TerC family protein [Limnohabitans sp.]|jgi:YjbE family integral membrane protein|uniref:TerC family protein n=1 Tax=Limnohabitans sp. TaxID=1907725 RepID=UPI002FDE386E